MNMLAARAEMAARPNVHSMEVDKINFVELSVKIFFQGVRKFAEKQELFEKKMVKKLLEKK